MLVSCEASHPCVPGRCRHFLVVAFTFEISSARNCRLEICTARRNRAKSACRLQCCGGAAHCPGHNTSARRSSHLWQFNLGAEGKSNGPRRNHPHNPTHPLQGTNPRLAKEEHPKRLAQAAEHIFRKNVLSARGGRMLAGDWWISQVNIFGRTQQVYAGREIDTAKT